MTAGGCFGKGCLFGCVMPLVLGVIVLALGGRFVEPLLGGLAERLRGESVWANRIASVIEMRETMRRDEPTTPEPVAAGDSAVPGRSARRPGSADPSALPKDIPLLSRPLTAQFNIGPGHALVFQRVASPRRAAIAELKTAMRRNGWELKSESADEASTIVIWRKSARTCSVEFVDRPGVTEVWLRSSAARQPPTRRTDPRPR